MGRPPNAWNALSLKRNLRKYNVTDKRQLIRKFLFGDNAHKYKCGSYGEPLNEFELDQVIIFLAIANFDNFTPSTFSKAKPSREDSILSGYSKRSNLDLEPGSGNKQDGGSPMDDPDALDDLFRDLGD